MKDVVKYYLDYINEYNEVHDILVNASKNMSKEKNYNAYEFYSKLDRIIRVLSEKNSFELIKELPIKKSYYLFGVIFYLLKDMDINDELCNEFDYLKDFIDYEVDVFMIVNCIEILNPLLY